MSSGYLKVNDKHISKWKSILHSERDQFTIGIHWQGNSSFEKSLYSQNRSMPYYFFERLKDIKGVKYLSLQKGENKKDIDKNIGLDFVSGQAVFDDSMSFQDTAAAIKCCDLVISTDSSIVHLAGALSVPTCILLSWVPEWRWGLSGDICNWYDSATIFRQGSNGDWKSVIDKVKLFINNKNQW